MSRWAVLPRGHGIVSWIRHVPCRLLLCGWGFHVVVHELPRWTVLSCRYDIVGGLWHMPCGVLLGGRGIDVNVHELPRRIVLSCGHNIVGGLRHMSCRLVLGGRGIHLIMHVLPWRSVLPCWGHIQRRVRHLCCGNLFGRRGHDVSVHHLSRGVVLWFFGPICSGAVLVGIFPILVGNDFLYVMHTRAILFSCWADSTERRVPCRLVLGRWGHDRRLHNLPGGQVLPWLDGQQRRGWDLRCWNLLRGRGHDVSVHELHCGIIL